jgi:hypothetical protein
MAVVVMMGMIGLVGGGIFGLYYSIDNMIAA